MTITVGQAHPYETDEAREVVAGYAFGEEEIRWKPRVKRYRDPPEARARRKWAYWSYDCIPAGEGPDLSPIDLLVASGINGRLDATAVNGLLLVKDEVSEALRELEGSSAFWELPAEDLANPPDDSTGWWMSRAWNLLMSVPWIGTAKTHKTLHHKRPDLFPLLDTQTLRLLDSSRAWLHIHSDLRSHGDAFGQLESWFAELAESRNEKSLTRLRIHDILLWCAAMPSQRTPAAEAGREILRSA